MFTVSYICAYTGKEIIETFAAMADGLYQMESAACYDLAELQEMKLISGSIPSFSKGAKMRFEALDTNLQELRTKLSKEISAVNNLGPVLSELGDEAYIDYRAALSTIEEAGAYMAWGKLFIK